MVPLPSPRRRGPKPNQATRRNLVVNGADFLHAVGYAASGVQDIVAAAGVPKGSFYNHFGSKEAFGAAVIDAQSECSLARLRLALGDEGVPPRERLIADFLRRSRLHEEAGCSRGCLFGNLSLEIADHSDVMRESLRSHFRRWRDLLETCISAAQKDGSIRNPAPARMLADFTLNAWEGALLRSRSEKTVEALALFQDFIFNGVLA